MNFQEFLREKYKTGTISGTILGRIPGTSKRKIHHNTWALDEDVQIKNILSILILKLNCEYYYKALQEKYIRALLEKEILKVN